MYPVDGRHFAHFRVPLVVHRYGAKSATWRALVGAKVVIDEVLEPIAITRNRASVGRDESQRVVDFFYDAKRTFVQQPMVVRAQQFPDARRAGRPQRWDNAYRSTASSSSWPGPRCASSLFMTTATT